MNVGGGDHMKKDCKKWQQVLASNGAQIPKDHANAYSKERDKFNREHKNPTGPKPEAKPKSGPKKHIRQLLELDDSDSEFNSSGDESNTDRTHCRALRLHQVKPRVIDNSKNAISTSNSFQTLCDGKADMLEEHIEALNMWAHQVKTQTKKKTVSKTVKADKRVNVDTDDESQLDIAIAENQKLRESLPSTSDSQKLMTMMQKAPPADLLQPGEQWALIDFGSGVDGLDCASAIPNVPLENCPNSITCITANGGEMIVDKMASVRVLVDGQECTIPFSHLKLDMPILSVRRHIHRGCRCRIREGGGYFRNISTRQKSRFVERERVYFIRMKILGQSDTGKGSLFGRPDRKP